MTVVPVVGTLARAGILAGGVRVSLFVRRPVPALGGLLGLLVLAGSVLVTLRLRMLGVRRVAVLVSRRSDGGCMLGVGIDRKRSGFAFLLHLFGDVQRHINRVGFARGFNR